MHPSRGRATPTARRSDILRRGDAEFAAYGLGGARMDRIAERAGVNKRLIYYYFENKESLFLAVLEARLRAHSRRGAAAEPDADWSRSRRSGG